MFFPRCCPLCGKILKENERLLSKNLHAQTNILGQFPKQKIDIQKSPKACPKCIQMLEYIEEPRCKKCGKPVTTEEKEYCYDCKKKPHFYEQGRSVWVYKEPIKQSIYQFKYQNKREYADFYGEEMCRVHGAWIRQCKIDIIIPVPLYPKKRRKRGFNQAEVLAKKIGENTGVEVLTKALVRIKDTTPQKELNDQQRKNNLKKAFKIKRNEVQSKRVLLVDDIYTTGSTIDEIAKELKQGGADKVYYISVCIGKGY